ICYHVGDFHHVSLSLLCLFVCCVNNSISNKKGRAQETPSPTRVLSPPVCGRVIFPQRCPHLSPWNFFTEFLDPFQRVIQPEEIWLYKNPLVQSDNIPTRLMFAISFLTPLAVICVVKIIRRTDKTEIKEAFLDSFVGGVIGLIFAYICYRQHYPPLANTACHKPYVSLRVPPSLKKDERPTADSAPSLPLEGITEGPV
uniref:Phosphatidic acid phosphatase type 2/haloperoxidase domain-containing protein n=1 Tax=Capra hircus TaxID=9925 RepID=A0A8C2PLM2_CAPHI